MISVFSIGSLIVITGLVIICPDIVYGAFERCKCAWGVLVGDSERWCGEKADTKATDSPVNECSSWLPSSLSAVWDVPKKPATWAYYSILEPSVTAVSSAFWKGYGLISSPFTKESS